MAAPRISGIYEIVNLVNGKRYIGSAVNFARRWAEHRRRLQRGTHHSVAMQRAWLRYGDANFSFRIVRTCKPARLIEFEQIELDRARAEYNICRVAGSTLGFRPSIEARALMSARLIGNQRTKGMKFSPEICARMGAGKIGLKYPPRSDKHRRKISESKKGTSVNWGRKASDETKEKLRAANLGKRHTLARRKKRALLNDDQVRQIRRLRKDDRWSYRQICEELGFSRSLVVRVCLRERYDWVDPEEPALTSNTIGRGGWKLSQEAKDRRSVASKAMWQERRSAGIPNSKHRIPRSAESRANIAAAAKAAWDRRRSEGRTTRPPISEEQRRNYSAAATEAWECRRREGRITRPSITDQQRENYRTAAYRRWERRKAIAP